MKISEMMTREVTVCRLDENLETAANLFWSQDVGILPVIDSRVRVVGLLTDRDVCLAAMFRARALREIPVGETMSERVVSCHIDDTLESAAEKMAEAKVRRLVVLDSEGRLEGIVALADLARVTAANKLTLKSAKVVLSTLCAISQAHGVKGEAAEALKPKATTAKLKAAQKGAVPETLIVPKAAGTKSAPKKKAAKAASKSASKTKNVKAVAPGKAKSSAKTGKSTRKS